MTELVEGLRRHVLGLRRLVNLWDYLRDSQRESVRQRLPAAVPGRVPALPADPGVAGPAHPAAQIARELGLDRNDRPAAPRAGAHRRADRSAVPRRSGRGRARSRPRRRAPASAAGPPPRDYLGARGTRFAINPGSSVARSQPPLVMAAEIVETSRLWARTVAAITAEQVEEVGRHLLKRQYSEPHWSARAGAVMAYETGHPVRGADRLRAPGRLRQDQPGRGAGDLPPVGAGGRPVADPAPVLPRTPASRAEAEELQERTRRRDLVVDDAGHLRLLRCAHSGRRHLRRPLRRLVEEDPGRAARPAHADRGRPHRPRPSGGQTWTAFPDRWRDGPHELPSELPLRARAPETG